MRASIRLPAGGKRFGYMLAALVALVILDGVITNLLIQGDLAWEGNPLLRTLAGGGNFLALKTAGALLCALILWDIYRHWRKLALVSIYCFLAVYAGIVGWNLCLFFIA